VGIINSTDYVIDTTVNDDMEVDEWIQAAKTTAED